MTGKEKIIEIIEFYLSTDEKTTLETYSITSETLHRYKRSYQKVKDSDIGLIEKIKNNFTKSELKALAKQKTPKPTNKVYKIDCDHTFKYLVFSDSHIGSRFFVEDAFNGMIDYAAQQKCDFAICPGDITEGMSNRAGHVYELTHIGYTKQKEEAIRLLSKWKKPLYCISGNHDNWYMKSSGAAIVQDICNDIENAEYVGCGWTINHDEGDIEIHGIKHKLWHGIDGASYALSYRPQKIVESFTGGEKPHVLIAGHDHKSYFFDVRNVLCIGAGCMSKQSTFMRGKRLSVMRGFWIIEESIGKVKGVPTITKFKTEWIPFR